MKISFIIPAYNEEKYITDCISSIIAQKDLPEHEIIMENNHSNDRTGAIVSQNFGNRIQIIREEQLGMCRARNRGAAEATGDVLVFFDADVRAPINWIKILLKILAVQPNVVGVYGPYRFLDLSLHYRFFAETLNFQFIHPVYNFIFNKIFHKSSLGVGGNFAVRADIFRKVGGWNEDIFFCGEELDLCKRLILQGRIIFNPDLWVWESGRRLRQNGFRQIWHYFIGYAPFLITGKQHKDYYTAVR